MKKIIASSVLATAALLPSFTFVEGSKHPINMVVEQKVEIRKGATDKYPIVKYIGAGQKIPVIDQFVNAEGETWYRVDLGSVQGWAISDRFTKSSGNSGVINGDNVNVRKGATTSYASIDKLSKGVKVKVIDRIKNTKGELWYQIQFDDKKGWVISKFVTIKSSSSTFTETSAKTTVDQKSGLKTVQVSKAIVRKGATTSYSEIAKLSKGTKVKVIDSFTNNKGELWYRVDLGKMKGWVLSDLLEPATSQKPESSVTTKKVIIDKAVVRKGASPSYQAVTYIKKGQNIKVIDSFTHKNKDKWYRIDLGKKKGWVHSSTFEKQINKIKPPVANIPGLPEIGKTVYSMKSGLPIRKGATTSYGIVTSLKLNQAVKVIAHYKSANGQGWVRVQLGTSTMGWVPSDLVSLTKKVYETKYVGTKNTLLRSGATHRYPVKEKLTYYSKVTILSKFTNSTGEEWLQVKSATGKTGWTPAFELVSSKNDYKVVYSLNKALIRSGASTKYSVKATLRENEPLIILQSLNNWFSVETQNGIRGWIYEPQTSELSLKRLVDPTSEVINGDQYIIWEKPGTFKPSYQILAYNRIKLSGGLTDIEVPSFKVKGIKSIEKVATSSFDKSAIITFEPGYTYTIRNDKDKISIKVIPTGLLNKKIIIDAGHGGNDVGAVGPTRLYEKDVNLATALLLRDELERNGAIVKLTRSTDVFLELSERTGIANITDYDAFISIHADSYSSSSRGSTSYYNTTVNFNGPRSAELGSSIQKHMVSSLRTYNRGVKEQDFYVNRMNELPSVLVELAFISNPNEEKLLRSDSFRQKAAVGITNGLKEYFSK